MAVFTLEGSAAIDSNHLKEVCGRVIICALGTNLQIFRIVSMAVESDGSGVRDYSHFDTSNSQTLVETDTANLQVRLALLDA